MNFIQKSVRVTLISFLIYGALVATHEGEYWPFSIYPMFSQAGNPWTRAIVRDVTYEPDSLIWETTDLSNLIGEPVSMGAIGVDQIDYSNFVSKTKDWDDNRVSALRTMLGEQYLDNSDWMIYKVHGKMIGNDSVTVDYVPFMLFTFDSTAFNPNFERSFYFQKP